MGEQVACPVCTLYLHQGMNLEDHLETHPKDQMIKALVALASKGLSSKNQHHQLRQIELSGALTRASSSSVISPNNNSNRDLVTSGSHIEYLSSPAQNVMIFNRQSTMFYHTTEKDHQRALEPNILLDPPSPLQVFNIPHHQKDKPLPPPPAYGTAINHLRSQHNQQDINYQYPLERSRVSNFPSPPLYSPKQASLELASPEVLGRTSPPSVLRFAESPIAAHYVERDNGDFIFQETPRHVVQCVESDNGKFSVIEKVIRSPPSLVQFSDNESDGNSSNEIIEKQEEEDIKVFPRPKESPSHQKKVLSGVTVISNVKLDPTESLDLMENILANTGGREMIWSELVDPITSQVKNEIEQKYETCSDENVKDIDDNIAPKLDYNKLETGNDIKNTSAATSVIRLANSKVASTSIHSEKPSKSRTGQENTLMKRPYKRNPKKLVVKLKPKPTETQIKDVNESLEPEPSSSKTLELEADVIDNEKCLELEKEKISEEILVMELGTEDGSLVLDGDKLEDVNRLENIKQKESEKLITEHVIDETDTKLVKIELDTTGVQPMVVHESSLGIEPIVESEQPGNSSKIEPDDKDVELTKLLEECWKHDASHPITEQAIVNLEPDKLSLNSNTNTSENGNEINSTPNDSTTFNSFPSTSSFSKPSTSSFAFREQTDFNHPNSYNDYPFSFLYSNDKNRLSPVYGADEQSWTRCSTSMFHPQSQIQQNHDLDYEKNSYIDLDACRKISMDINPLAADTLNIRTDEKMPAKGEISEQESNGDIDNSWSQPLFQEPLYRFSNPYENYVTRESWSLSNDDIFYPQDLSSATRTKITVPPPIVQGTTNEKPSIARKRNKKIVTRLKKRQFRCPHCTSAFALLKERSAHMIEQHGYKRINRRLTRENPTATVTTCSVTTTESAEIKPVIEITELGIVTTTTLDPTVYPRTKYDSIRAGVYRMLMNFNLSVLQEKTNVEVDKALFESKSFCCYTCKRDFISVKSFDEHLADHPAECFSCTRKFTRWSYFSIHLKRHLGWKDFACTSCEKKFVTKSAVIEHMRIHTGSSPLKCNLCEKHFKRYSNLTQHKSICHRSRLTQKKDYVCYCGEVLPSKARFLWHKEIHDAKPKCCPYCRDRFVHMNSLKRHIRLTHSDKYDYTQPVECPICNQVYAKSSLKVHMTTHSMETQFECPICNKSFSTKWNLKIHSWVHANRTSKPFKCDHCTKAFVREIDYKNHINSYKHIKPFTCEYCGCKFIRKYNYMRHRREHHGQKKFSCDLCGKLFHRHYYLIEHRRTHTGERPFLCTICGKSSTTKTNHNKHLKIHHSRDPFTSES